MTVAEFCKLPDDDGPVYYELRHGEVVAVSRPKIEHQLIQGNLCDRLRAVAPPGSYVQIEVSFRALPEHELRVADVAYVSPARWSKVNPDDYLAGSPDIVVEVLSPSNSAAEIYEKEQLCLANGANEFWVLDGKRRTVRVSTPDGPPRTWTTGQDIPLPLFGGSRIAVDAIFGS
jgi:Uma2 family endonuclease